MQIFSKSFLANLNDSEKYQFNVKAETLVPKTMSMTPLADGNLVYEVRSDSDALNRLIQSNWAISEYTGEYTVIFDIDGTKLDSPYQVTPSACHPETSNGRYYLNDISNRIIKPQNKLSYIEAIQTAYELSKTTSDFAGVILRKGAQLINPLHPLVVLGAIDANILDTKYTAMFFFYSNKDMLKRTLSSKTEIISKQKIDENINLLIQTYSNKILSRKIKSLQSNTYHNNVTISYKLSKYITEDQSTEYFMIAHQVITDGIFAPYYGTSVLQRTESNISGITLSPHMSANIALPSNINLLDPMRAASICTGNELGHTLKGWQTLSHSNLSSALSYGCMMGGAIEYADACIAKAFEMYKYANIIKEPTNVKAYVHYQVDDSTGEIYPS